MIDPKAIDSQGYWPQDYTVLDPRIISKGYWIPIPVVTSGVVIMSGMMFFPCGLVYSVEPIPVEPPPPFLVCGTQEVIYVSSPVTSAPIISSSPIIPHSCWQSVDCYDVGGRTFTLMPMWIDLSPNGMLMLLDDFNGNVFSQSQGVAPLNSFETWSGVLWDKVTPNFGFRGPDVVIVSPTYWVWVISNSDRFRVYRWQGSGGTILQTDIMNPQAPQQVPMWLTADNLGNIAFPAFFFDVNGEDIQVYVSHDFGLTFNLKTVYNSPTYNEELHETDTILKRDSNGILWVVFVSRPDINLDAGFIRLYKSLDNGDTWNHVNDISVTLNNIQVTSYFYIDGTTLWIVDYFSNFLTTVFYKSTDGGVTFNNVANYTVTLPPGPPLLYEMFVGGLGVNGNVINASIHILSSNVPLETDLLVHSTDGGATWTTVFNFSPPAFHSSLEHARFRRSGNTWAFVQGELEKEPPTDRLCYFISFDNGATWTEDDSPVGFRTANNPVNFYI